MCQGERSFRRRFKWLLNGLKTRSLENPMPETRLEREAEFHNRAFAENTRAAAGKFYAVAVGSKQFYRAVIGRNPRDKCILEYGCGTGSCAFDLARHGARVTGIDISVAGIDLARQKAVDEGVAEQTSFQVMDAEQLAFPGDYFDLVCGSGILHHLDLKKALGELVRVLKPDGQAVFFEPLGHNPLIQLYRRLTPQMRSADEHPLSVDDLQLFFRYFAQVEFHYFHLCSLMAVPFGRLPGFHALRAALEGLDRLLFRLPFLRKQAWIVVVQLHGPGSQYGR